MFRPLTVRWLLSDTGNPYLLTAIRLLLVATCAAATGLVLLMYLPSLQQGSNGYSLGDWLISYPGSFLRRGLAGEVILGLHDLTGWPVVWIAGAMQIAAYLLFLVLLLRQFLSVRLSGPILLLAFSPALFFFPLNTPPAAFRKEILGFLALALMANALLTQRAKLRSTLLLASATVFAFAVFAHEANVLFAPHLLILLLLAVKTKGLDRKTGCLLAAVVVGTGAAAALLGMIYPGIGYAQEVCQEVLARGLPPKVCDGAIGWLDTDLAGAFEKLRRQLLVNSYLKTYSYAGLLALAPFLLFRLTRGSEWAFLLLLATGILPFAPLFFVALDWGRWIYMAVVAMTILLLAFKREGLLTERFGLTSLAAPLYATTWSLPICCGALPEGLFQLLSVRLPFWMAKFQQAFL